MRVRLAAGSGLLSAGVLGIALTLAGCGGGSSSSSGLSPFTGNLSQQNATATSQNVSALLDMMATTADFETLQSTPPVASGGVRGRATISDGCPTVTDNRTAAASPIPDPWIVTFNYGVGCTDPHLNRIVTGSIRTTFTGFSANPQNPTGTATAQFINLNFNAQTFNGTASLTYTSRTTAALALDITAQSGNATRRLILNGTLSIAGTGQTKTLQFSGTGTYNDSGIGTFGLTFDNLIFTKTCQFPTAGTLVIEGFSTEGTVTFGPACGNACARIGNGPSTCFNL